MKVSKSTLALVVGGAFTASIAATSVVAAENPFALKPLASGYMVAEHHGEKGAEGKCGTGKCGSEMKSEKKTEAEGKCGTGKCGSEMKSDKKTEAEGKCGTGKCGAEKK
jgi:uncharacterized low-complexity protein